MIGGPAKKPMGDGWQFPPEQADDEAKRQIYAAHRRRRHPDIPSLVALVVIVAVVVGILVVLARSLGLL